MNTENNVSTDSTKNTFLSINPYKAQSKVNPQREDGHRRINNDVFQALIRADITGSAYKIILTVIDRSWGFDQPLAKIGYSHFIKATGLSKVSIRAGIKEATNKHLLEIVHPGDYHEAATYLFNKHYDTWLSGKETYTVKETYTGKADNTTTGKVNSTRGSVRNYTRGGKPLTSKVSLPTENLTENNNINIIQKENSLLSENNNVKKKGYGEFLNVLLTNEENEKLIEKLGKKVTDDFIEQLSCYIQANGKKYKDHYATILNWERREHNKQPTARHTNNFNPRILPEKYTSPEEYQPEPMKYTSPEELRQERIERGL